MKYTKIPVDTFKRIQLNAGIIVDSFVPETGTLGNILGASTGGANFTATPEFSDYGEDIDNCPKNTMELKKQDSIEAKLSGTFVTIKASTAKLLAGAADIDANDSGHIIPRKDILATDFNDIWWVGDYSDDNDGEDAGFVAIHMMNALNTGGFQIQSTDKGKGQFAFEFTGHFSMANQDLVPYEIFIKEGGSSVEYWNVNQILSHASSSFTANAVEKNGELVAEITADESYAVTEVTVIMGGNTLENAYSSDTVTIASVTGDVTIVVATEYTGA